LRVGLVCHFIAHALALKWCCNLGRKGQAVESAMENIVAIQHWLYSGMASGLGDVAGGNTYAIVAAIAAAILFGAVHALMPGHGKTVLVSYHLGQSAKLR
jgi:ABC-type nickel/cobalt efflux system permease component RcnA